MMGTDRKKQIFAVLLSISTAVYLIWRIGYTIPYDHGIIPAICGWVLMAAELIGGVELLGYFWLELKKDKEVKVSQRKGGLPDVDVFVTTFGESAELLEHTLKACLAMEYSGRYTVWLLDDSNRAEMKALAESLGTRYISRTENHGAKAGNLNNALKHAKAPYIAVFDADMAPRKEFLKKTMALMDERTGFVQTPQSFRNPDLFQAAWGDPSAIPSEQDFFYRSIQPGRTAVNAVVLSGSNMLINRAALISAGGFAEDTITEDFATGIEIEKKKYRSRAIDETLAEGLTPDSFDGLIRQRRRWARGCIQSGRRAGIRLGKGLSFEQRLSYFIAVSYWFFPVKRLIYLVAPLLFALGDIPVMRCDPRSAAIFWLPMFLLTNIGILSSSGGTRTVGWSMFYETCLSPFLLIPVIGEAMGIREMHFDVTSKDRARSFKASRLVPFAICIGLCAAALIKLVAMKGFSGVSNYAVLIGWLLYQLYMQLCAFFFVLACRRPVSFKDAEPAHQFRKRSLLSLKLLRMIRGAF